MVELHGREEEEEHNRGSVPLTNCTGPLTDASTNLADQDDGIREFLLRSRWEKGPDEDNLQECLLYISETPA